MARAAGSHSGGRVLSLPIIMPSDSRTGTARRPEAGQRDLLVGIEWATVCVCVSAWAVRMCNYRLIGYRVWV